MATLAKFGGFGQAADKPINPACLEACLHTVSSLAQKPIREFPFMNTSSLMAVGLALTMTSLSATAADKTAVASQDSVPAATVYREVERGANHKVWQRETYERGPDGKVVTRSHKYTELASGMHYQNSQGEWQEAKEEIETAPGGAVARQGQHQVIFANNLNSYGAIDMQTPDGKRLRSNVLGLGYMDKATGQSVLIAEIQDSQGELISANQVLYPDAFKGVKADAVYKFRKASFEQDIILREKPADPEAYGMNSETTELVVITEFLNAPAATVKERRAQKAGLVGAESEPADQEVSWGVMRLGHGKAFDLNEAQDSKQPVSVQRRYEKMNGRDILLEIVPVKNVQASLRKLPLQSSRKTKLPALAAKTLALPATPLAATEQKPIHLAATAPSNEGYVLDYIQVNGTQGDYVFQGDTTYLVTDATYFNGAVITLEGGTVIKYDTRAEYASLQLWGTVNCDTSPYRPAVFTSINDNSVGENLSVAGAPTYYFSVLSINAGGAEVSLHDLRFSYLQWGLHPNWGFFRLSNVQFNHCLSAFYPENCASVLENVLMGDVEVAFGGADYTISGCNVTISGNNSQLSTDWSGAGDSTIALTNSLLLNVGVDGDATLTTDHTARLTGDASQIFQTVGGGSYYLPTNSPYRGAGSAAVGPAVLASLATKTTSAPIYVYTPGIYFGTSTNLFPLVPRDTNAVPDLGYHYTPLDYIFSPILVTNATITINTGTAVGFHGASSNGANYTYGIALSTGGNLNCLGEADRRVQMLVYNLVQEQAPTNWLAPSYGLAARWAGVELCQINSRFSDWSCFAHDATLIHAVVNTRLNLQHSQFYGGTINIADGALSSTLNIFNCLFERVGLFFEGGSTNAPVFRNNLLYGGSFEYYPSTVNSAVATDNLFDHTTIDSIFGADGLTYVGGHNAYVTNCSRLPAFASDVILSASPVYQTGTLGRYYLPANSPLINAGSTTAVQAGLYHFTTQTNQVKEAASTVDIGYHYVATDANGKPVDTDGDGLPDYLEDANGNGLFDAGDLSNWGISQFNGLSNGNGLSVFTPLK